MSVNASNKSQDANYIKNQKDTMVEEIDSQYVVQIINNNGVNFKKLDLQLIDLKGFFFSFAQNATYYIDLIIKDTGELQ